MKLRSNTTGRLWIILLFVVMILFDLKAYAEDVSGQQAITKKKDLDRDGYSETTLYIDGATKKIIKAELDENGDGKPDGVIYYKNGFRDSGEKDVNGDGKVDTWIRYYITGIPWIVTRDKDGDGKVDYWKYIKNGFVYKREWDRNLDGKPDVKILVPGKSDLRSPDLAVQVIEKQFDEDYDGNFEKVIKIKKRVPHIQISQSAGAIGEF